MNLSAEFSSVDLGDKRLNERLVEVAKCLERHHGSSISFSCGDWKNSKGAYRFFDNDRFSHEEIVAPHFAMTKSRINSLAQKTLVIHDTTQFNYSHHRETEGLGYLTQVHKVDDELLSYGFLMHASLAITPEGIPLGLTYQKQWSRDISNYRKVRSSGKKFTQVPIENKESYKWVEGINASCDGVTTSENLVHVCDRDADVYEVLHNCKEQKTHFVIRAVHGRCTDKQGVCSFDKLSKLSSQGNFKLSIQASQKRKARVANILVKYYKVRIIPPESKSRDYDPIEIYVVSAKERKTKSIPEKERVNWKLLTDLPVRSFKSAMEKISWYQARWNIEVYFKTLKSGFGLERSRLRSIARLNKFAALVSVLAWRVFWLTKVSRNTKENPGDLAYTSNEISVLKKLAAAKGRKLTKNDTLYSFTEEVARLGGYLARKSDPPPGVIVIWRGLQRLHDISLLSKVN